MAILGWGGMPVGLPGRFAVLALSTALASGTVNPDGTGGTGTGGGTTPAAPAPLDITARFKIGSTRTGVPLHYVESFGPGQVPAGTRIYGALDSGANVPVQMSAMAYWPDGSAKTAKLALTIPGPRAEGAIVPVRLRTSQGTPDNTPCITLAEIAARSDFRVRCHGHDFGAEEYELRLNDLIAEGVGGWTPSQSGTNYPTAGIEIFGAGPEMVDFVAWAYVRRTTDKAVHKTYKVRLYVTYFKSADGFQVLPEWEQPNSYDGLPDSVATAGPARPQRIAGIVELYDGQTLIHACGGPNDWRATTVPAANFNAATGLLTYPAGARLGFSANVPSFGAGGVPWGFAAGEGLLPSGVLTTEAYYPGYHGSDRTKGPLWRFRGAVNGSGAGLAAPAAFVASAASTVKNYVANTSVAGNTLVSSNGAYYVCRTSGTAGVGAPGPSGTGAALTDGGDGTARWENATAAFGSPGGGTVRMYPLAHSYAGSGGTGWTREMRRVWVGAGPQPWAQVGLDFSHAMRKTRMLPPMDYEAAANVPKLSGALAEFELHQVSVPNIWNIEATGDGYTEDRIGPMVWSHGRALLLWDDPVAYRRALVMAGTWGDFQHRFRDERSGQWVVTTRGPADNGVTYPGHAPVNMGFHFSVLAAKENNPSLARGNPAFAPNFPRISGPLMLYRDCAGYHYEYNDMGGAAHLPNPWTVPYILTGDAAWLHMGSGNALMQAGQAWRNGGAISPNQDTALGTFAPIIGIPQPRAIAWALREMTNLEMLAPDSWPNKQIVRDILTQNIKFYRVNAEKNYVRHLGLPTWSATTTYDVGGRPYHIGMMYYMLSHMRWRYGGTEWANDLDVVLACMDKYFVDMFDETLFPGALYFHCEYGVSQTNNAGTGAFDVRDTKNLLGRGVNAYAQNFAEVWKINYGDPPAEPNTTPAFAGKNIVFYRRTSLAGKDGSLPVQYQISTGSLGMRGISEQRVKPVIPKILARMGHTAMPLMEAADFVAHWSALPISP